MTFFPVDSVFWDVQPDSSKPAGSRRAEFRKLKFLIIIKWKTTHLCTWKSKFKRLTCLLVILDFLIGKPAVCARFSTHPRSPVIHKQIQEIALGESEPYVAIQSSLAQLLLFVCTTAMGAREAERVWETQHILNERKNVKAFDGTALFQGWDNLVVSRKTRLWDGAVRLKLFPLTQSAHRRTHLKEICFQAASWISLCVHEESLWRNFSREQSSSSPQAGTMSTNDD